MITVVAGFTRSGTSLAMRMLHRGGMEVYAENHYSYETHEIFGLPHQTDWLDNAEGKVIKMLETLEFRPPKNRAYRFIVMMRNSVEQAKSQIKFLRATGANVPANGKVIRTLARSLERDTPKLIKMLRGYPESSVLIVSFEELIQQPKEQAQRLSAFCGGLNVGAMASQIVGRQLGCLPYLMELDQITQEQR